MKDKIRHLLAFLLLSPAIILSVHAQGTAFSYQGKLNDGANPATGLYDVRFSVCDALTNGSTVAGPLTNTATGITNGLFSTVLDFGAGVFTGPARWLQLDVRTNGAGAFTPLAPRELLLAVPYAVMANSASNLLGVVPVAQLSGTLTPTQLPSSVLTNNQSGLTLSGTFTGNGAGLTNVNLLNLNANGAIGWTTNNIYTTNFISYNGFVFAATLNVGNAPWSMCAADVNGDGKVDLISANMGDNTLTVLTNNGNGVFVPASTNGVGISPYAVYAADVNGDGKMDLISGNVSANTLTVLTNSGNGSFVFASAPGVGNGPFAVCAADVNGDGKVDLISANFFGNTLSVLTNDGSGGFVIASTIGVGSHPRFVCAADVNADGKVDLICANVFDNTLTVLTNNGNVGFVFASTINVGNQPYSICAADVNGDGKVDLISANSNDKTLTVLTNNGNGGFVIASTLNVGLYPTSVSSADVNGDSKVDLICANWGDNTLSVLTNNGSGGFVLASTPNVGNGSFTVCAADVNGDGKMDLVSANIAANTLTVLTNASVTAVSTSALIAASFTGNAGGLSNVPASAITGGLTANVVISGHTLYITNGIIMNIQ